MFFLDTRVRPPLVRGRRSKPEAEALGLACGGLFSSRRGAARKELPQSAMARRAAGSRAGRTRQFAQRSGSGGFDRPRDLRGPHVETVANDRVGQVVVRRRARSSRIAGVGERSPADRQRQHFGGGSLVGVRIEIVEDDHRATGKREVDAAGTQKAATE